MSTSERRSATMWFFAATGLMEAGAGLALLVTPALVIELLLASPAGHTDIALARWAGAALLSLGAACWWARGDGASTASRAIVVGMSVYNAAVIALVLAGSFGSPGRPILLVVAAAHGAMTAWCVALLRRRVSSS